MRSGKGPVSYPAIFCAVYIALFCWLGLYACPSADDYSFSSSLAKSGFWGFQASMYSGWQGRILFNFLTSLAYELLMGVFYGFFPFITLLTYGMALYFLINTLFPQTASKMKVLLTLLGLSGTLALLTSLNETLYWVCGMPYFWTTSLLLLAFALAVRAFRGSAGAFWLGLAVFFLNGTVLEQSCVLQGVAAFLAALFFLWRGKRRQARMAGAFWLVSVAAFLVIYLAPGTSVRMGAYAQTPFLIHLARTLVVAAAFGAFTVLKFFTKPLVWAFLIFLPDISQNAAPFDERLSSRVRGWHIFLVTILIAPLMQAIAGWAGGEGLPLRSESLAIWMMGTVWVLCWSLGYRGEGVSKIRSSRFFGWRWAILLLCLVVNSNFIHLVKDLTIAPLYAAENRARTAAVLRQRADGERNVVIPLLETRPALLFYSDLRPWLSDWKNQSFAAYYGLSGVAALPRALCNDAGALERVKNEDVSPLLQMAEQGDAALRLLMGEMYDPAFAPMKGVPKDAGTAIEWYRKSAKAGSSQACRRLTRLCFNGGKRREAAYWFLRYELLAALKGDTP